MTAPGLRPMCFNLRRIRPLDGKGRWRWTVYSYPDLAFVRDGEIAGDLEAAERAARVAIAAIGGTVDARRQARSR